jgi:hypothetical protein
MNSVSYKYRNTFDIIGALYLGTPIFCSITRQLYTTNVLSIQNVVILNISVSTYFLLDQNVFSQSKTCLCSKQDIDMYVSYSY